MPPREDRQPGLGKEGALVADLLKLLLKIRAREAMSRRGSSPVRRSWSCSPRAGARGCRSWKAGASRSSAATRSTWSKGGSPLRSRTASW
jgi:hypothetical protein